MELTTFFDHPSRLRQEALTTLAMRGSVFHHLIWRFDLSQLMATMTALASTALLAFLSPFLLALVPITGGWFAAVMTIFPQSFFQFQIA
jgi:hypothetical protein